jgi:hypothetical protein
VDARLPTEPPYSHKEVCARGRRYYEMGIRQSLEGGHHGDFVWINTDTGEYVAGEDREFLSNHAMEQWPFAGRLRERVGYRAVARSGFRWEEMPKMTTTATTRDDVQKTDAPPIDPSDLKTISRLGRMHYEAGIRQRLEPECHGKYVAINVQTGEYKVGATLLEVLNQAIELWPNANRYFLRVGYPGVARVGGAAWRPR